MIELEYNAAAVATTTTTTTYDDDDDDDDLYRIFTHPTVRSCLQACRYMNRKFSDTISFGFGAPK